MRYKITIRRKDGSLLIKETNNSKVIQGYAKTAKMYDDKIVKIEEKNSSGQWRPAKALMDLIGVGITATIGLGILGAFAGGFSS